MMTNDQRLDEMLRKAAAGSMECFMNTVTRDYDPDRTFTPSPRFERKIQRLTRRARHPYAYRTMRRVASVLLTVVLAGAAWLAVDSEARAAFTAWIREVYENSIIYEFFGSREPAALPEYAFASPPEGFVETEFFNLETICVRIYAKGEETIQLSYMIMSDEGTAGISSGSYRHEAVQVGKLSGDFYEMEDPSELNELIWFDEENQIVFRISAFLDQDEMLMLAEKIVKK